MRTMRTLQREKTFDVRQSVKGTASVVVCIMALLFAMEIIVVAVRFLVG